MKKNDASSTLSSEQEQARQAQQAAGETGRQAGRRYSLDQLLPRSGDPRRPPAWLSRAIGMVVIAVFLSIFVWRSFSSLRGVIVDIIICLFLALAMEPAVVWLIRHGWKRPVASITTWLLVLLVCAGLIALFGDMFVNQVIGLVNNAPHIYNKTAAWVAANTPWTLPKVGDLGQLLAQSVKASWLTNIAGTAMGVTGQIANYATALMTILFVTYYMSAYMPRVRQVICSWLRPAHQRRFLVVWTVVQGQVSSYLSSRIILALISSVCMSIYMIATKVSYWLPLAILYALVSQFVPMVGGIIGAILPVIIVWSSQGLKWALFIVVYTTVYQQIENMLIAPKVQQRTMAVPPAVGLIAVFAFSDVFGVLGAFLALPIVASCQVVFNAYTMRNELVDSSLLYDPVPEKTTRIAKMANAGENFGEKLSGLKGTARIIKGSTGRIMNETERQLLEAERAVTKAAEQDASATIPITKQSRASLRTLWKRSEQSTSDQANQSNQASEAEPVRIQPKKSGSPDHSSHNAKDE
jgi:predicted PurR-regulated permease PerM